MAPMQNGTDDILWTAGFFNERFPAPVPQLAADGWNGHDGGVLLFGPGPVPGVLHALQPEQAQEDEQGPEGHAAKDPGQPLAEQILGILPAQQAAGDAGLGGETDGHGKAGAG